MNKGDCSSKTVKKFFHFTNSFFFFIYLIFTQKKKIKKYKLEDEEKPVRVCERCHFFLVNEVNKK